MKIFAFFQFDTNPRFPPFLQYVRCKFRVTFVRRRFRDGYHDVNMLLQNICVLQNTVNFISACERVLTIFVGLYV